MLLPASLNVACHEFLGVLLEEIVDVIEQAVQRFLQRRALLRQRGGRRLRLFLLCTAALLLRVSFFCSAMRFTSPRGGLQSLQAVTLPR